MSIVFLPKISAGIGKSSPYPETSSPAAFLVLFHCVLSVWYWSGFSALGPLLWCLQYIFGSSFCIGWFPFKFSYMLQAQTILTSENTFHIVVFLPLIGPMTEYSEFCSDFITALYSDIQTSGQLVLPPKLLVTFIAHFYHGFL